MERRSSVGALARALGVTSNYDFEGHRPLADPDSGSNSVATA